MKRFTLAIAATVLSAGVLPAMAALSPADKEFATKAATGGQAEVAMGRLATEKAGSPQVREFGQRMVTDHTEANQALGEIARHQQLTLPGKPTSAHHAMEERLRAMKGQEFDAAYMRDMIQDHQQDVADFRKEAETGQDPALKAFAQKYLPIIEQHLQMAQSAAKK
jgi:putative membrane protein